jgi:hypothetical protein
MKEYRGRSGEQRTWLKPDEIERTIESELRKAKQLPTVSSPVVDVERFIAKHLNAKLDQHAPLDADVLGQTEFFPDGRCHVKINRALTEVVDLADECPPGIHGRWRATMAHEASHIIFHRHLFVLAAAQGSLTFGETRSAAPTNTLHRCDGRAVSIDGRGSGDWREVQANMGMAALLMPKTLFAEVARTELEAENLDCAVVQPGSAALRPVIARLAERFAVSRQATEIRLQTLRLVAPIGQSPLR